MPLNLTTDAATVAIVEHGAQPDLDADFFTVEWTRTAPAGGKTSMHHLSREFRYIKITGTVDGDTDMAWLRILIGPDPDIADFTPPTSGTYDVYAQITDNPEVPLLLIGSIYFS